MKHEAVGHPKMHDLAACLNLPLFAAHGILEMLWHHAGDYAPDGDIGKLKDSAIARAVDWRDDPAILIGALVDSRWLDRNERYRLLVHDWPDHAQEWVKKKLTRVQKVKRIEDIHWLQVYDKPSDSVSTLEGGSNNSPNQERPATVRPPSSHRPATSTLTDNKLGNNDLSGQCRDGVASSPRAGGISLAKFSKGSSSSGIVVVESESSQNDHSPKSDFTIRDWFERQYARHPNKRDKILGEQQVSEHLRLGKLTLEDCERTHIAWCESEDWRWKNGAKVKQTYAQWISDEGYRYMPNGHAKAAESPYETPEQMQQREARENESDEAARAQRRAKATRKETTNA